MTSIKRRIWVIADTHLGHDNLREYCGRPRGFNELILKRLSSSLHRGDTLIHLGDICIGDDLAWNLNLMNCKHTECRFILVRGNHDHKSNIWYMDKGWDFVCDSFTLTAYGKKILFSHIPQKDIGYDLNIHGHFHNSHHRDHEPELVKIKNDKQWLFCLEDTGYNPVLLKHIVLEKQKLK